MLKLRKVAITGGLSCGKSSVCHLLEELGAYVVSADKIVHQLLSSDANLGQEIVNLLGPDVRVNQTLDRSRIARVAFQDPELLQALEELIHPLVYKEIDKEYRRQQNTSPMPSLFVAEIPLLFESGRQADYDDVVVVMADPDTCYQRFKQTTGYNRTEFNNRMAQQLPLFNKIAQADYVIRNDGTLSDLQQITRELYQELTKKK